MKYEICYLVGESNEGKLAEIKAEVEKAVTGQGGTFFGIETLDRRKLAYKVGKEIRGLYVTRRFEIAEGEEPAENDPIREMTKKLNLYSGVIRFLVIKADKLPELKQREIPVRQERGERRYDRGRGRGPVPFRRSSAPRPLVQVPAAKSEEKAEATILAPTPESQAQAIDQKLDEILNI